MHHQPWRYTAACDLENLNLPLWDDLPGGGMLPEVQALLYTRGFTTPERAAAFLIPERYTPTLPSELPNLDKAVRLLLKMQPNEKILVWGDFDVDGQTSTAIWVEGLRGLGFEVNYYIPDRKTESHGVHMGRLQELLDRHKPDLLLICDTGSSSLDEVEYANMMGVTVIIADHHALEQDLPRADAFVNPQLLRNPEHPLWTLSGAGVSYLMLESLYQAKGRKAKAEHFLDLCALGLIADVMEQVQDTRYLIQRGLRVLQRTERPGLGALALQLDIDLTTIGATDVAFKLAPALNAFGRMDSADMAVELLMTSDNSRARILAATADGLNQKRKLVTSQMLASAEQMLADDPNLIQGDAIVLHSPFWDGAMAGIIAANLTETYHKPVAIVVESEEANGIARGSIRSVAGYSVNKALRELDDLLENYGGHEGAGGFGILMENLPQLRRRMAKAFADTRTTPETPPLLIEGILTVERLTLDFAYDLQRLAPFGSGNPNPIFVTPNLELRSVAKLGRDEAHRRLILENRDGQRMNVFWWNSVENELPEGRFDLAYTVDVSTFRGERELQIQLVDWKQIEAPTAALHEVIEVIDYRHFADYEAALDEIRAIDPQAMVWAEGFPTAKSPGTTLSELAQTEALVILTAPADNDLLKKALLAVHPRRAYLIGIHPPLDSLPDMLKLLWGLAEKVIIDAGGTVNIHKMMERLGQSKAVVQIGLEYLAAIGKIEVVFGERTRIDIGYGTGVPMGEVEAVEKRLRAAWDEVDAYRRYVQRVDAKHYIISNM